MACLTSSGVFCIFECADLRALIDAIGLWLSVLAILLAPRSYSPLSSWLIATGKFVEDFVFETWADYLRRFDRFTAEDLKMQEERHHYHVDAHPPKITRRVASAIKD